METELFAQTYRNYGLATVRYPELEVEARVEAFENGRVSTLCVMRAGKPRENVKTATRRRTSPKMTLHQRVLTGCAAFAGRDFINRARVLSFSKHSPRFPSYSVTRV